jgi:putative transposase
VDYSGERVQAAAKESGIDIEGVKRSDEAKGFVVQPKRGAGSELSAGLRRLA